MKNLKNIAVAVASLVIFSNVTNAQALKANYPANAESSINVKYLGEEGEYLIFKVTLQSATPSNSLFAIDDKNEGELYASGLAASFKEQTVKIERTNVDQVLNFRLVTGRKTYVKSFSVNRNLVETTTVAEEANVTKL